MMYALNIGTRTNGGAELTGEVVHQALQAAGFRSMARDRRDGTNGAEGTHIFYVADENSLGHYSVRHRIYELAVDLQQDCIAICPLNRTTYFTQCIDRPDLTQGRLFGPKVAAYAPFDPLKFYGVSL